MRAAAESARIAGFSPIAIDQYGDRDTIAAAKQWYSLDDLRSGKLTLATISNDFTGVPVAIVGGLSDGYRWLETVCHRFRGANPELFELVDQPEFLKETAFRASVAFPETRVAGQVIGGRAQMSWLIKQRSSCGGLGVRYCTEPLGSNDSYLQKRVCGRICGASYLSDGRGSVLLGVCRLLKRRIGNLPFVFAGAIGPIEMTPSVRDQLNRLGDAFVTMTGLSGPFNIDVVINDSGVTLLEVNPRWSSTMEIVERSWSDAVEEPCSMFEPLENWKCRRQNPGLDPYLKRIVFARRDRTVSPSDFDGRETGERWDWKDIPNQTTLVKRHEPLATIIAPMDKISLRDAFRVSI